MRPDGPKRRWVKPLVMPKRCMPVAIAITVAQVLAVTGPAQRLGLQLHQPLRSQVAYLFVIRALSDLNRPYLCRYLSQPSARTALQLLRHAWPRTLRRDTH